MKNNKNNNKKPRLPNWDNIFEVDQWKRENPEIAAKYFEKREAKYPLGPLGSKILTDNAETEAKFAVNKHISTVSAEAEAKNEKMSRKYWDNSMSRALKRKDKSVTTQKAPLQKEFKAPSLAALKAPSQVSKPNNSLALVVKKDFNKIHLSWMEIILMSSLKDCALGGLLSQSYNYNELRILFSGRTDGFWLLTCSFKGELHQVLLHYNKSNDSLAISNKNNNFDLSLATIHNVAYIPESKIKSFVSLVRNTNFILDFNASVDWGLYFVLTGEGLSIDQQDKLLSLQYHYNSALNEKVRFILLEKMDNIKKALNQTKVSSVNVRNLIKLNLLTSTEIYDGLKVVTLELNDVALELDNFDSISRLFKDTFGLKLESKRLDKSLKKLNRKLNKMLASCEEKLCTTALILDYELNEEITTKDFLLGVNINDNLSSIIEKEFSHLIDIKPVICKEFASLIDKDNDVYNPGIFKALRHINIKKGNYSDIKKLFFIIKEIYLAIKSIGIKEGFVYTSDISKKNLYPFISELLNEITCKKFKWLELNFKDRKFVYNTVINLAMVNLYVISQRLLHELSKGNEYINLQLKSKIKMFGVLVWGHIDLDIRDKFKFKNMKLNKNVYCGFDTEYQNIDFQINKFLTYQLAVTGNLELEIPVNTNYLPEGVNCLTGEKYFVEGFTSVAILDSVEICSLIDKSRQALRSILHGKKDLVTAKIIQFLIQKGVPHVQTEEKFIFTFPYQDIKLRINKFGKEGLTSQELIKEITSIISGGLDQDGINLINDIRSSIEETDRLSLIKDTFNIGEIIVKKGSDGAPFYTIHKKSFVPKLDNIQDIAGIKQMDISNIDNYSSDHKTLVKNKWFVVEGLKVKVHQNLNLLAHYNAADLCSLNDFENFKDNLSIINKSFVTFKSLKINDWDVNIRDTMLLTAAGGSGLAGLGKMHGIPKKDLQGDINNMENLMNLDWEKFKEYALGDSYITLIHGLFMKNNALHLKDNKMPITISSLSKKNLLNHWKLQQYKGYQPHPEFLLNDADGQTPKGLKTNGVLGLAMPLYTAAVSGGENLDFKYGVSRNEKTFIDYDLNGCYTTIMSQLGNPNYSKISLLTEDKLNKMTDDEFINSYTVMNVDFEFPESVKYPNIPTLVDKDISIYPLIGNSTILGPEYVVAKNLGCRIKLIQGYVTPWEIASKNEEDKEVLGKSMDNKPFFNVIKDLQTKRKQYLKGNPLNTFYKLLGNSLYGMTCQGLSRKRKFDTVTKTMSVLKGNALTNSMIGGWITAVARSAVSESMNNIKILGHDVISVTTDGFITDLDNLENTLVSNKLLSNVLLHYFRRARKQLGHKSEAYEVKTMVDNLFAWTTRGQLGFCSDFYGIKGYKTDLTAMTGYQRRNKTPRKIRSIVSDALSSKDKEVYFMKNSLRGANEIFKKGGHVSMGYTESKFRVVYDNKRLIIPLLDMTDYIKLDDRGNEYLDLTLNGGVFLDSKPYASVDECRMNRFVASRLKSKIYKHNDYAPRLLPRVENTKDLCIRWLLRLYVNRTLKVTHHELLIGLSKVLNRKLSLGFIRKITEFLGGLELQGTFIPNSVPRNKISEAFWRKLVGPESPFLSYYFI